MIRKLVCLAVLMMLLGLTTNAFAAPWALWQGSVSDNYSDPANWVDGGGAPLGHMANSTEDTCIGVGSRKDPAGYWPVLYDNPIGGAWGPFSAHTNLWSMSEWSGVYAKMTFAGGLMYFQDNQYMMIGRRAGDTCDLIVDSGGIGAYVGGTLYGKTRWLKIGDNGSSTNAGKGTLVQNGGAIYAQAVSVGVPDPGHEYQVEVSPGVFETRYDASDPGSSATVNGGELYVGLNYVEASFCVGPDASMTINPGGYMKLVQDTTGRLTGDNDAKNAYVKAKGALNIVADGSGSATVIVPAWIMTVAELENYFGYDDGGTFVGGNVNAIYNGGAGTFVFNPTGTYTEITVIPEPATIALLGIGGLCLLRRKRS